MQFAMYLVDNGVMTCEDFFEALKLQIHSRPQLGALAIDTRRLSFRQVSAILSHQCDEPNQRFGEIAMRLGYLKEEELSALLVEQAKRVTPLTDVLVENGFLSEAELELHFADYRNCMQRAGGALAAV